MKTALEWLIEQCPRIETIVAYNVLEEAKQMEKEQIVDAYIQGYTSWDSEMSGFEYYTKTHNQNK